MNANIKDSTIALTASVDDNSVVLKSQIGEHCMIEKTVGFAIQQWEISHILA